MHDKNQEYDEQINLWPYNKVLMKKVKYSVSSNSSRMITWYEITRGCKI